jgi:hypothetical protein
MKQALRNASMPPSSIARRCAAALAVAALASPLLANAATGDAKAARDTYRQDRAACMAGNTNGQSRADCLYEARSVLRDARRGKLQAADTDTLARNALARCDAVPADARNSCERLVRGEGERLGSVEEGGIVMWVAEAPADTSMAAAPPMQSPSSAPMGATSSDTGSATTSMTTVDSDVTATAQPQGTTQPLADTSTAGTLAAPAESTAATPMPADATATPTPATEAPLTQQQPTQAPVLQEPAPQTSAPEAAPQIPLQDAVPQQVPTQESAPASLPAQPPSALPPTAPDTSSTPATMDSGTPVPPAADTPPSMTPPDGTGTPAELETNPVRPASALPQ